MHTSQAATEGACPLAPLLFVVAVLALMRAARVGLGKPPCTFSPAVPRAAGHPCDAPPSSPALQLVEEGQGEVLMEADRMEPLRSGKSHLHFSPFTRINVRSKAHTGMARLGGGASGSGSGAAPPGRGIGNLASLRQQLAEKEMEAARAAEEQRRQERARQRQQRQLQALEQHAQQTQHAQQQPDRQQQRQQRQQPEG